MSLRCLRHLRSGSSECTDENLVPLKIVLKQQNLLNALLLLERRCINSIVRRSKGIINAPVLTVIHNTHEDTILKNTHITRLITTINCANYFIVKINLIS